LGYSNGELRFFLGWAQEVAGDHAAARKVGDKRAASWNLSSKNSRKIITSLEISRSSIWVSVTKPPRWLLSERATAANPIEKDPLTGPWSLEIIARVAAQMGEPDRAIAALQKLLSIPYAGSLSTTMRLLPRCSGSIQCSIRCEMIRASKN